MLITVHVLANRDAPPTTNVPSVSVAELVAMFELVLASSAVEEWSIAAYRRLYQRLELFKHQAAQIVTSPSKEIKGKFTSGRTFVCLSF